MTFPKQKKQAKQFPAQSTERAKQDILEQATSWLLLFALAWCVDIQLEEVFEYSETVVEVTYGERLKRAFDNAIEGFADFWKGVLLFIVGSFPFLIMWGILIFVLVKIVRRSHRRRMEKRAAMDEARRKADGAGRFGAPHSFADRFRPARPVQPAAPAGPAETGTSEPAKQPEPAEPVEPVQPAKQPGPAEDEQLQSPEKKGKTEK